MNFAYQQLFSVCEDGWTYLDRTKSCYKYVDTRLSWNEARESCQTLAPDYGDLASVHDDPTNNFLSLLTNHEAWLGGYEETEGSWIWSDGTSWDYVHWGPSEPNNGKGGTEDYLQNNRYASGGLATWNDAPLNASYIEGYICQYRLKGIYQLQ